MTETPETFDVDAWLSGAKLPERSVEVYRRADLLAQMDGVIRRIEKAETDEGLERSLGEGANVTALREEYELLKEQFDESGLVVTVRAVTEAETADLNTRMDAKEFTKEERPYHEIALASVSPKLTVAQAKAMASKLGPAQVTKIWNAIWVATGDQPRVSPHFLPKRSGQETGQE